MSKDFLWVEKYRPKTVDEVILPINIKNNFKEFIRVKNVPNLLLSGPPGIGKTSIAKTVLEELGCDYLVINGSLDGNIATLRNEILSFASAISFSGGRKYVILDEADYINPTSTQPALRNFIVEYSQNCGFILTCNYKNKIIKELHSRCSVIDFKIPKTEELDIATQLVSKVETILSLENIKYNKNDMLQVIKKYFPDIRRCLGELQRLSISGELIVDVKNNFSEISIKSLFGFLKTKDFTSIRKWVTDTLDNDSQTLFTSLYFNSSKYMTSNGIAELVLLIAKYQYQEAFVADKEINVTALLVEVMLNCEFK